MLKQVQTGTRGAMHHSIPLPSDLTGPSPRRVALISELFNANLNWSLRQSTVYKRSRIRAALSVGTASTLWHVRLPVVQTRQDKHTYTHTHTHTYIQAARWCFQAGSSPSSTLSGECVCFARSTNGGTHSSPVQTFTASRAHCLLLVAITWTCETVCKLGKYVNADLHPLTAEKGTVALGPCLCVPLGIRLTLAQWYTLKGAKVHWSCPLHIAALQLSNLDIQMRVVLLCFYIIRCPCTAVGHVCKCAN